ncbi:DUF7289 family protein [Haloarcula onubensis]|uniref:Flagellin n=1 Tax=Haloarcula onubensis TaxID=2950539 RepID=A0ABU2FRE1_9EURY|nr:hypothetical protein [Halomicroarcula sp. S3CR25-11]MDS0282979.1 hypothetical protein [Halomicroarcula sp. S3CR25-11]
MNRRRAVSDLVSFTLVFSTIVFLIGALTVTGITTLNDVRVGTESNVAEETMLSFATTLSDHRTDGAPTRSTTIKLQGHSFRHADSTVNVTVTSGGSTSHLRIDTGAFVRETNTGTRLVYASGGVFRIGESGGVIVVRQPPIRCGTTSAHLPLTSVRSDANLSADGRVTVRSELTDQRLRYPATTSQSTTASSVSINVSDTARPEAWQTYLDDSAGWNDRTASGHPYEYECSLGSADPTGRVVVHESQIDVTVVN